jgi:hypothetical protein
MDAESVLAASCNPFTNCFVREETGFWQQKLTLTGQTLHMIEKASPHMHHCLILLYRNFLLA